MDTSVSTRACEGCKQSLPSPLTAHGSPRRFCSRRCAFSVDLAGKRFGWLVATRRGPSTPEWHARWYFRCDCGIEKLILASRVRLGATRSCGCRSRKHGQARAVKRNGVGDGTPEYNAWLGMRYRCTVVSAHNYASYGGRGITICARWADFRCFFADMGPRPSARHSLDRINNDGNYEPGNCRWATPTQQGRNRRDSKLTLEQVREIRRRVGTGEIQRVIASDFGIDRRTVGEIARGEIWKDAG